MVWLVDRIGRRHPLCLCFVGAAVGFFLDGKVFSPEITAASTAVRSTLALSGITLGYLCRSIGVGPLPQVVSSEVIPLEARLAQPKPALKPGRRARRFAP